LQVLFEIYMCHSFIFERGRRGRERETAKERWRRGGGIGEGGLE